MVLRQATSRNPFVPGTWRSADGLLLCVSRHVYRSLEPREGGREREIGGSCFCSSFQSMMRLHLQDFDTYCFATFRQVGASSWAVVNIENATIADHREGRRHQSSLHSAPVRLSLSSPQHAQHLCIHGSSSAWWPQDSLQRPRT